MKEKNVRCYSRRQDPKQSMYPVAKHMFQAGLSVGSVAPPTAHSAEIQRNTLVGQNNWLE